jgi:hypothetical protein
LIIGYLNQLSINPAAVLQVKNITSLLGMNLQRQKYQRNDKNYDLFHIWIF